MELQSPAQACGPQAHCCVVLAAGAAAESAAGRVIIFTNLRASVARIIRHLQSHSALFQAREFVGQGQGAKKKGQVGRALLDDTAHTSLTCHDLRGYFGRLSASSADYTVLPSRRLRGCCDANVHKCWDAGIESWWHVCRSACRKA
jgi:hypothetical protein